MTNRVKYESSFCGRLLPENLLKAQGNWPTFIASSRDWRYLAPWSASDINEAARLKKPIEKVIANNPKLQGEIFSSMVGSLISGGFRSAIQKTKAAKVIEKTCKPRACLRLY